MFTVAENDPSLIKRTVDHWGVAQSGRARGFGPRGSRFEPWGPSHCSHDSQLLRCILRARLAQLAERVHGKDKVSGSTPLPGSRK